jgi:4-hydroxy-3-polyprenylbenzoate decarboxylase
MRLVKGLTVDLNVPAEAEIILEGFIDADYLEDEGPFGEMTGYMGMNGMSSVLEITCIYHRKTPIYQAFISEFPPSESSTMRGLFYEANMIKRIRGMGIEGLKDVAIWNNVASNNWCVIQMAKRNQAQVWQVLRAAAAYDVGFGKYIIAVDPDINPRDTQAVIWSLCYATQPYRDTEIGQHKAGILDPSCAPQTVPISERIYPTPNGNSVIMIDATRKWPYPPVSLPAKEYMERGKALWEALGLPEVRLDGIWHGYELGVWNDDLRERAKNATEIMK